MLELDEAELLRSETPSSTGDPLTAGGPGLMGPKAAAVSGERRRQALARVLWNVYEIDPLHDPKSPLLEVARRILGKEMHIRDTVRGLQEFRLPSTSLTQPTDMSPENVDALLSLVQEIAEGVETVAVQNNDPARHREMAATLSRKLPLLRPFTQLSSASLAQMIADLRLLLLRWCIRDRHLHLNLEMAGLAMFYMDRMLAEGTVLGPDADDATILAWAATCTMLAARFERDDINRRLDSSGFPYAALCGWSRLPSDIIHHSVDTLFFRVLRCNANRQHVYRFMAVYSKYLRTPGAWVAATYVATCLYMIKELASMRPSLMAIQSSVLGAMLVCPAPVEELVEHARQRVGGAELRPSLQRLRDALLAERPCFSILQTLFGVYATMGAQAFAEKWTDAGLARWAAF